MNKDFEYWGLEDNVLTHSSNVNHFGAREACWHLIVMAIGTEFINKLLQHLGLRAFVHAWRNASRFAHWRGGINGSIESR